MNKNDYIKTFDLKFDDFSQSYTRTIHTQKEGHMITTHYALLPDELKDGVWYFVKQVFADDGMRKPKMLYMNFEHNIKE